MPVPEVHQVATSRAGRGAADGILRSLTGRVRQMRLVLAPPAPEIMDAALAVRARYASLDLVDAVDVALAAGHGTDAILTGDLRDFRVLRPVGGDFSCFRVLPDDL
ncbi:VapC toxin family PIN domain ribonuclease [Streptomyces sp. NPDC020731]|uniref:VapC toxin family PIN domain ribonuclease n=1 Tax=Streptomyces sp. NPDC020731 TaxID=3365085 RepID=UPI00378F8CF9